MRTVTVEEVLAAEERLFSMEEEDTITLMMEMVENQPFIQAYIASLLDEDSGGADSDMDALANLSTIIWLSMSTAADGRLAQVDGKQIEEIEEKFAQFLQYAEGESDFTEFAQDMIESSNQKPLLIHIIKDLFDPENPYGVSEEGIGVIFTVANVIITSLDHTKIEPPTD